MTAESFFKPQGGELKEGWFTDSDPLALAEGYLQEAEQKHGDDYSGEQLTEIKKAYAYRKLYDHMIMNRAADPQAYDAAEGGSYQFAEWQVDLFKDKKAHWSERYYHALDDTAHTKRRSRTQNISLNR